MDIFSWPGPICKLIDATSELLISYVSPPLNFSVTNKPIIELHLFILYSSFGPKQCHDSIQLNYSIMPKIVQQGIIQNHRFFF